MGFPLIRAEEINNSRYTIDHLSIRATAENTTAAKEIAIKMGERIALQKMLENIGSRSSYSRYINDQAMLDMISSIKITEEMMTKDTYSGFLSVVFNEVFVKSILNNIGIGPGKTMQDVILYIPILDDGKFELLSSKDIWYKAAYDKFFEQEQENIFILDNHSPSNGGLLSRELIERPTYKAFETLLIKYASNVIIITLARYNRETDQVDIVLKKIDAENVEEKSLNYVNKENLSKEDLIKYASVQMFEFIKNSLMDKNIVDNQQKEITTAEVSSQKKLVDHLDIHIPISDLREFVFAKNLLANFNFIKNFEVKEITFNLALIRISFDCHENELVQLFQRKNFLLDYLDGHYTLNYNSSHH
jgi:hypothetical protein